MRRLDPSKPEGVLAEAPIPEPSAGPRRRLRSLLLRAAICGAWLVAGFAVAIAILGYSRSELETPPASLMLLDAKGEYLGELSADGQGRHGYWSLAQVPARVASATVAVEDRRFWSHPGVDAVAIARALEQNFSSGRTISGASTLAMQVARMQRPGPRTYLKKAVEASTALWLVARHGRRAVLIQYLRLVPYGNQVHGIGHAARRYFDKPVADLSWAETAFLAAIPQAPARMNPHDPLGRARAVRRGLQILDLLHEEGMVLEEELELARRQIRGLAIPTRAARPEEAIHALLRFEDRLGAADPARPILRTTLDLDLQRDVTWMARRSLEKWRARGAGNVAALVVELPEFSKSGEAMAGASVRAAIGSADFFDDDHAGAIDYLRVPRSSGSTLKPFFYGLALDRGLLEPTRVMDDLERGAGGISNADGRFLGPLLPRFALANSRNVPAANLLAELGLDEGWSFLGGLGLHGASEGPGRYGLGLTIGSLPVTVEDLATAYTVLAGDGRLRELSWLADGEEMADAALSPGESSGESSVSAPRRFLSEEAARLVSHFLSDSQARLPSFPRTGSMELPFPAAMKTGTSSRYRDAWTVAYTRRWLVVVWVGHPDHRPMHKLSGYRTAAGLARQILIRLHPRAEDGLEMEPFPAPNGYDQRPVCVVTGHRAGPACARVTAEWHRTSAPDGASCRAHRLLAVERRSGLLASHETPPGEVEIRGFLDLPARYAAWQTQAGLPRAPRPSELADRILGRAPSPPTEVRITSPMDGLHLFFDPETPKSRNTLALTLVADPPPKQILWKVNGEPYALADYPFTERWALSPGDHTIQAEIPFTGIRSQKVNVRVE